MKVERTVIKVDERKLEDRCLRRWSRTKWSDDTRMVLLELEREDMESEKSL